MHWIIDAVIEFFNAQTYRRQIKSDLRTGDNIQMGVLFSPGCQLAVFAVL